MTSFYLQFRFFYALFRDDSYIHVINVLVVWYIKFLVACMKKHVVSLRNSSAELPLINIKQHILSKWQESWRPVWGFLLTWLIQRVKLTMRDPTTDCKCKMYIVPHNRSIHVVLTMSGVLFILETQWYSMSTL